MAVKNAVPLEGVLNCWTDPYDLPDLLLAVSRSGKTGRLAFSNPEGDKTIHVKDGKIVFADSSSDDDGLGQYLLRQGQISLDDFRRVSKMVTPGKRLGALLVAEGVLEPKELVPAVVGQVWAIILSLFRRTESWYGFKEEELPRKESITLDMPVAQLVLEGVQLVESWRRISKGVGDLDAVYQVASATEVEWSRLKLESGPTELLTLLEKPARIAEVCARASIDGFDACRILWAFRSLEWIEPGEISVEAAAEMADRAETVAPPPVAPDLTKTVLHVEPPPPIPQRLVQTQVSAVKSPEPTRPAPRPPLPSLNQTQLSLEPPPPAPAATRPEVKPPGPALHHTQLFVDAPPEEPKPPSTTGELMEAILDGRGEAEALDAPPAEPPIADAPSDSSTRFFPGASALPPEEDHFQGFEGFAALSLDYSAAPPRPPEPEDAPSFSSFADIAPEPAAPESDMPLIEATVVEAEELPPPIPPQLVATQPSIYSGPAAPSGLELFAMNDPFQVAAPQEPPPPPPAPPAAEDPFQQYADASLAAALPSRPRTEDLDLDIGNFFTGDGQ